MSNYHYTYLARTRMGWGAGRSLKEAVKNLFNVDGMLYHIFKDGYSVVQFSEPTPIDIDEVEAGIIKPEKDVSEVQSWTKGPRLDRIQGTTLEPAYS